MDTTDLSTIERSVVLRAPRARVWRAITNAEEFAKWFGVKFAGRFEAGARLQMTCLIEDYEDQVFWVFIEDMIPERLFSWRWHPGAVDPSMNYDAEPTTLVAFALEEVEGGTRVTVTESGFDQIPLERRAKVYKDNVGGWEYQMTSLEKHLGQPV